MIFEFDCPLNFSPACAEAAFAKQGFSLFVFHFSLLACAEAASASVSHFSLFTIHFKLIRR
jgi:hypothetical protein